MGVLLSAYHCSTRRRILEILILKPTSHDTQNPAPNPTTHCVREQPTAPPLPPSTLPVAYVVVPLRHRSAPCPTLKRPEKPLWVSVGFVKLFKTSFFFFSSCQSSFTIYLNKRVASFPGRSFTCRSIDNPHVQIKEEGKPETLGYSCFFVDYSGKNVRYHFNWGWNVGYFKKFDIIWTLSMCNVSTKKHLYGNCVLVRN